MRPVRPRRAPVRAALAAVLAVALGSTTVAFAATVRPRDGRVIEGTIPGRLVLASTWTTVARGARGDTAATFDVLSRAWILVPGADVVSVEPGAVRVRDGARLAVLERALRGSERAVGAALRRAAAMPDTGSLGMRVVDSALVEVDVPAAGGGRETVLALEVAGTWADEAHGGSFEPAVVVRSATGEERVEPMALIPDGPRGPRPLRFGGLKVRAPIAGTLAPAGLELSAVEVEVTSSAVARAPELGYDGIRAGSTPNSVVWVFQVRGRAPRGIGADDSVLQRQVSVVDEQGREFAAVAACGHGINDQSAFIRFIMLGPPDSRKLDVRIGTGRATVELP